MAVKSRSIPFSLRQDSKSPAAALSLRPGLQFTQTFPAAIFIVALLNLLIVVEPFLTATDRTRTDIDAFNERAGSCWKGSCQPCRTSCRPGLIAKAFNMSVISDSPSLMSASSTLNPASRDQAIPLHVASVSALAKSLREQLEPFVQAAKSPSHVQVLNWLARAAGHRNYQSLRAAAVARPASETAPAFVPTLTPHAAKALTQFDARGRLQRWPTRFAVQRIALWALWQRFDLRRSYSEREVNTVLNAWANFGDPATLRRELINMKLLGRKSDCSEYWKEPIRASDEVRSFLHALRERTQAPD
jgi:hypothetical protein